MENLNAGRSVGETGSALYRNSGQDVNVPVPLTRPDGESARSVQRSRSTSEQGRSGSSQSERKAPSREEIGELVDGLNRVFDSSKVVRFDISEEDGEIVVQVVDRKSDEVVRTIPPDRLAEVHRSLNENASGALLDDRA